MGHRNSSLFQCLMLMSGIYAGWFIFALTNFRTLLSSEKVEIKEASRATFVEEGLSTSKKLGLRAEIIGENMPFGHNAINKRPTLIVADSNGQSKPSLNKSPQTTGKTLAMTDSKNLSKPEASVEKDSDNQTSNVRFSSKRNGQVNLSNFKFNRDRAEKAVLEHSTRQKNKERIKILTAFLEQPMKDTIPGTGDQGKVEKFIGTPADYVIPLPLRKTKPEDLQKVQYPKLDSCHNLQAKLPVDEGLILDTDGKPVVRNLGNLGDHEVDIDLNEEAKICPVEADPWLPWIHDVFPSPNGDAIRFVAQNKRRCKTSVKYIKTLRRLEPQVALMQHVSVKRLDSEEEANALAPELWSPSGDVETATDNMPRYRLAPFEESDEDGQLTRFICRFHTIEYDTETSRSHDVILGETLSTFPANYEFATFRKGSSSMITPRGKDNGSFWLSNFQFDCPVPDNGNLRESISVGDTVLDDGTPTIYVDLVPIRTSTRFGSEEVYLPDYMTGFHKKARKGSFYPGWLGRLNTTYNNFGFDPKSRWGDRNVLPKVEASGRWENVPVCLPPKPAENMELPVNEKNKQHTLAACLWASSSFHTRGNAKKVTDTSVRIREWIEFHLMSGFDHIYVYDNSGAHTNETSLVEALSIYNVSEVTRVDWPFLICNNNIPAHINTGERSSQYAAENSCNRRFGPYTEWIGAFDADEYLIPMGENKSMKDVVKKAHSNGINILSFRSTRAYPNMHLTQADSDGRGCGSPEAPKCRTKRTNETFLDVYNCDFHPLPKPEWAMRAKKQLYRPEYVPTHFVHYATITKGLLETYKEATEQGKKYDVLGIYDSTERFTDEINEAVMIHTKSIDAHDTVGYESICKFNYTKKKYSDKCFLGVPFPNNVKDDRNLADTDGYEYNCYQNQRVINYWGPLLRSAMKKRDILN